MNVLLVTPYYKPSFTFGGPVNSISKIAESLVKETDTYLEVFTTNANGVHSLTVEINKETWVDGVRVRYFKRYFPNNSFFICPGLTIELIKSIKRFDVVHVNMWWNWVSIISGLIAVAYGKKLIVSPRGSITEYIVNYKNKGIKKSIHSLIGSSILNKAHFHITSNVELIDTNKITKVNNFSIIYNLIDLPLDSDFSKENDRSIFTLLFMSRVHPKKGIELLLHSIALINQPVVLKIAGDGEPEYVDLLKKLITELKIEDRVVWIGWLNNKNKFKELAAADLFVLTSYNENFANVVVESLFVATPVLITNEVGLSDFVRDHELGWTTSCDVQAITEQLEIILSQKDKLIEVQQKSKNIILNTFTEKQLVSQYVSMYRKVISN